MLDFQKLIPQIVALAHESSADDDKEQQILCLAQESFSQAEENPAQLEALVKMNGSTTFWPVAIPLEEFGKFELIRPFQGAHTVVACDGSQIMPTQHEVHCCFLLNVGSAVFHYGDRSQAQLLSFPYLYHRQEDLYPLINQRRVHIDESVVSFERGLKELQTALDLASAEKELGHQVLTLVDGSLIPFGLDRSADKLQTELLERFEQLLDQFSDARLPLLGYISHSRSLDVVNILRVWRCPYPESRCNLHCGSINEEDFPCSEIWPFSDRQLFSSKLPLRARSTFFQAQTRLSNSLRLSNQICFTYLNIGQESARIEIPRWLFEAKELLAFALSTLLLQVQKGHGYPVSLAEAHNMAVVRQIDRNHFFHLLTEQLLLQKKTQVSVSPKEQKKRRGIV